MLSGLSSYLFGTAAAAAENQESPMQEDVLETKRDDHDRLLTREEDEEWILVDKANGSAQSDPLENLLIEHPSMSVYSLRGRTHSTGADSEGSSSAPEDNQPSQRAVYRSSRPHLTLNTAKASKVATRSMQKAVKSSEHQKLSRNHIQRSNRLQKHNNQCRRPRRSERMMQPSGRSNRSMH